MGAAGNPIQPASDQDRPRLPTPGKGLETRLPIVFSAGVVSRPAVAAMNCQQTGEEIAAQDRGSKTSEAKANDLWPGYYAVQAVGMAPYVGDSMGLLDMVTDMSGNRELD